MPRQLEGVLAAPFDVELPGGDDSLTVMLAARTVSEDAAQEHDQKLHECTELQPVVGHLSDETVAALRLLHASDVGEVELAARSLLPAGWKESVAWVPDPRVVARGLLMDVSSLVVDGLVRVRPTDAPRDPALRWDLAPAAVEVTADPRLLDDRAATIELIGSLVSELARQRVRLADYKLSQRQQHGELFAQALAKPVTAAEVAAALGLKVTVGA